MSINKLVTFLIIALVPSLGLGEATLTGSPLTGNVAATKLPSEMEPTNVIVGTISASASLDDNNNNSAGSHPIGGEQYYFDPSLALQQLRSHLQFNLAYRPGLRLYVPTSSQPDRFSQLFGGTLHYDFSKRLAIDLRQDYVRTNDPFEQFRQAPFQPGIGLLNRPGTVLLPNEQYTFLQSGAEVNYKLAKHTLLGVNGEFMKIGQDSQHHRNNGTIDTRDASGSAFLAHQFTAKQTFGMQYQLVNMVFSPGDSRTITQGVFLFDQVVISPHMSFTIFAGPQYSKIHDQEIVNLGFVVNKVQVSKTLWSPAAGATFKWQAKRTAVEASFVRRVADGRGMLGSVQMNDATLDIREKIAHRWVASVNGHLTEDTLLQVPGKSFRALYIGPEISRQLASSTWLRLSYQHLHRNGTYLSQSGFGNHNRLTLTFEHSFNMPLGR